MIHYCLISFFFLLGILHSLTAHELSILTMFKNEAFYLKEWIEYHRMIGVDHFYLYNNGSTDNSLEVLSPYIEEGLVETIDWDPFCPNWIISQADAFRDGLMRASGESTWVAVIDLDEFIVPVSEKSIPECLANHYSHASAVYMNWRNFGTSGVKVTPGEPLLFRLNECSEFLHSDNAAGKTIVRPECVHFIDLWSPHQFPLEPGCLYANGDGENMEIVEGVLQVDGKPHSNFIRVNHYRLRDENYFHNYRMGRIRMGLDNINLLLQQYDLFSKDRDHTIQNLIRDYYPDMYEKIWKNYSD